MVAAAVGKLANGCYGADAAAGFGDAYLTTLLRPHELGFAKPSFPGWIACQVTRRPISPLLTR